MTISKLVGLIQVSIDYLNVVWNSDSNDIPFPNEQIPASRFANRMADTGAKLNSTEYVQIKFPPEKYLWQGNIYFYDHACLLAISTYANISFGLQLETHEYDNFVKAGPVAKWIYRFYIVGCQHPNLKIEHIGGGMLRYKCPDCTYVSINSTM